MAVSTRTRLKYIAVAGIWIVISFAVAGAYRTYVVGPIGSRTSHVAPPTTVPPGTPVGPKTGTTPRPATPTKPATPKHPVKLTTSVRAAKVREDPVEVEIYVLLATVDTDRLGRGFLGKGEDRLRDLARSMTEPAVRQHPVLVTGHHKHATSDESVGQSRADLTRKTLAMYGLQNPMRTRVSTELDEDDRCQFVCVKLLISLSPLAFRAGTAELLAAARGKLAEVAETLKTKSLRRLEKTIVVRVSPRDSSTLAADRGKAIRKELQEGQGISELLLDTKVQIGGSGAP